MVEIKWIRKIDTKWIFKCLFTIGLLIYFNCPLWLWIAGIGTLIGIEIEW